MTGAHVFRLAGHLQQVNCPALLFMVEEQATEPHHQEYVARCRDGTIFPWENLSIIADYDIGIGFN